MTNLFNILPTSRTAIEVYRECPYKRYLQFFYDGTGIVPAKWNVPLTTGSCVHKGVEYLLRWMKNGNRKDNPELAPIDDAVQIGVSCYEEIVQEYWKGHERTKEDEATVREQVALTEALIRAWGLVELPRLGRRFRVVDIELEETLPLGVSVGGKEIVDLARADAILEDRGTGDWFNYSLKTQRSWYDVAEKRLKISLQAAIECMAVEYRLKEHREFLKSAFEIFKAQQALDVAKRVKEIYGKLPKQLMGTKSCFLIKGDRKESKYEKGLWITYNPLIRGYRSNKPATVGKVSRTDYAWSWFTVNPDNKSGTGILGKTWGPFNVWETEGGVKWWINKLIEEEIQKECGDPLKQVVLSPTEWFRRQQILDTVGKQIARQEEKVFTDLREHYGKKDLLEFFPMNQDSCYPFTNYPCEYLSICNNGNDSYRENIANDPIGSGEYVKRVAHHEIERRLLEDTK